MTMKKLLSVLTAAVLGMVFAFAFERRADFCAETRTSAEK